MIIKKILFPVIVGFVALMGFSDRTSAFHVGDMALSLPLYAYQHQHSIIPVAGQTNGDQAKSMIDKMGKKAISFLSNESLSLSGKEKKFRQLLRTSFDMGTIGRFALARNWKVATQGEKKEYQRLFESLVVKVYSSRFNDYKGEGFDVVSFRDAGKKDVLVTSYIVPASGSKVKIDWRVRNKNGQYKIIDVIIEGVSMSVTQRSDFASVIQRGGGKVEVLLAHLR